MAHSSYLHCLYHSVEWWKHFDQLLVFGKRFFYGNLKYSTLCLSILNGLALSPFASPSRFASKLTAFSLIEKLCSGVNYVHFVSYPRIEALTSNKGGDCPRISGDGMQPPNEVRNCRQWQRSDMISRVFASHVESLCSSGNLCCSCEEQPATRPVSMSCAVGAKASEQLKLEVGTNSDTVEKSSSFRTTCLPIREAHS